MGMLEMRILDVDLGSFGSILQVWPTPLEPTASFGPVRRNIWIRQVLSSEWIAS